MPQFKPVETEMHTEKEIIKCNRCPKPSEWRIGCAKGVIVNLCDECFDHPDTIDLICGE